MQSSISRIALVLIMSLLTTEGSGSTPDLHDGIENHRTGTLVIQTQPGAEVAVKQLKHEFWFGTAIAQKVFRGQVDPEDREKYLTVLKKNFNSAVHENALKWYSTQRQPDSVTYDNAEMMLKWCEENGLRVRGHCVFWGVEGYVQQWLKELDNPTLRHKMYLRATDLLKRFRGRIPEYDVNNEMLHGHYYAERLGPEIRVDMFRWCKETDPKALLYVNDHGILNGNRLDDYERQIESFLDKGMPVGGIGVQGHFNKRFDPVKAKIALDRLSRFDLPIKVTEFDVQTDEEKVKAESLVDLYTTCFSHPAVEGILMWGFWEGAHWRPEAALWKKDWSLTPAAEAYRDLVHQQWWTDWSGRADDVGRCDVKAFFGQHKVTVDGEGRVVTLKKADGKTVVAFSGQAG